jgi:basic membrane protein A
VVWALEENNKWLITYYLMGTLVAAKADIVSGKVAVHDYMSDNACPM